MTVWNMNQQVCATCRYWSGLRDIDFNAEFSEAIDEMGQCYGPDGSFRYTLMGEGATCSLWDKFR